MQNQRVYRYKLLTDFWDSRLFTSRVMLQNTESQTGLIIASASQDISILVWLRARIVATSALLVQNQRVNAHLVLLAQIDHSTISNSNALATLATMKQVLRYVPNATTRASHALGLLKHV